MKHQFIKVDQTTIHYVEGGPTQYTADSTTETIVFLHGFPEYWATWHAQLDFFSKKYRVIAPDLPGYNLSDKPQEQSFYEVPNLIQFIAKLIQQLAPNQKVILVAHDWGGAIAWPLTAFFPHLVERLVILNAAHPSLFTREMIRNPEQRQKSEYIHELIAENAVVKLSKNGFKYLNEEVFTGMKEGVLSQQQRRKYLKAWSQPGAIAGMLQYYKAMPQLAPSQSRTSQSKGPIIAPQDMKIPNIRITCPTLILWGEQDQAFVKQNIEGIQEYVPNVEVIRYLTASHWLQHELPDEVNKEIEIFLQLNENDNSC
ncbi:alpha/beta fold hydrolase [Paraglaciecola sp. 2405UD69-4]|uniref:alpha/beta fold hydrolase n=1 Tax=Paraglaciecola sp. 2405UD69-4 TaxID=3391836 RepID=UPI0039C9DBAB